MILIFFLLAEEFRGEGFAVGKCIFRELVPTQLDISQEISGKDDLWQGDGGCPPCCGKPNQESQNAVSTFIWTKFADAILVSIERFCLRIYNSGLA